jgi:trimethylamine--corrinoid protein Co-methyltransferase
MDAVRPHIALFTDEQVDSIVADALAALERVGVLVENDDALALLDGVGVRIAHGRAYPAPALVQARRATAPSSFPLFDRDGAKALHIGGDTVHFDPGSAALSILDPTSRQHRPPTTRDLVHLAWVTGACRHVEAQSTGLVPADVAPALQDRFRLYVALKNGRKPVITGTFAKDAFAVMRELLVAVRGSDAALREKPLAVFDCCPSPPLKWSDLTAQALVDCARAGVPAELVSMPLGGATSPVTLREMVVQHCAESLSGVLIHQLAAPGAPIVWGGSPAAFDMRHGTTPMGAIETMMVDVGYAQVGKRLGLPTQAYMGMSDAKVLDHQTGAESAAGTILAALAGINMVSGAGMLDFESCQSLEKLVLDNETCGMALRLVRGIAHGSASRAVELLGEVVELGSFLGHPHTRASYREELFIPGPVVDRRTLGGWEAAGSPDAWAAAAAEVQRILGAGNQAPLADDVARDLDRIMAAEAARLEVTAPPSL